MNAIEWRSESIHQIELRSQSNDIRWIKCTWMLMLTNGLFDEICVIKMLRIISMAELSMDTMSTNLLTFRTVVMWRKYVNYYCALCLPLCIRILSFKRTRHAMTRAQSIQNDNLRIVCRIKTEFLNSLGLYFCAIRSIKPSNGIDVRLFESIWQVNNSLNFVHFQTLMSGVSFVRILYSPWILCVFSVRSLREIRLAINTGRNLEVIRSFE